MTNMSSKSSFEVDLKELPQGSKSSVYALLLVKLTHFPITNSVDNQQIKILVSILKQSLLNHDQSLSVLNFHLKQTIKTTGLSSNFQNFLTDVIDALSSETFCNSYTVSKINQGHLEMRIPRQLESQLAIHLIQSPSDGMWASVNKISAEIVNLIKDHYKQPELFATFLHHINGKSNNQIEPNIPLAFGHFSNVKSLDDVIDILDKGGDLAAVMLIHFMFIRDVLLNLNCSESMYKRINTKRYSGAFKQFLLTVPQDFQELAHFFTDYVSQSPELYSDRGRGTFNDILDNCLGISIDDEDRKLMPKMTSYWYPDCLCQKAKLDSFYVNSLIKHDVPYVAGPSGMTSLFIGALTLLGNFDTEKDQSYYLLSVLAYMVSGGLHSIHEVLSVPKVRLGLLPDYQVSGNKMANYDSFFSLFSKDKQVVNCLDSAWFQTISWMNSSFPTSCTIKEIVDTKEEPNRSTCLIL